jgi:hypothetical protein
MLLLDSYITRDYGPQNGAGGEPMREIDVRARNVCLTFPGADSIADPCR